MEQDKFQTPNRSRTPRRKYRLKRSRSVPHFRRSYRLSSQFSRLNILLKQYKSQRLASARVERLKRRSKVKNSTPREHLSLSMLEKGISFRDRCRNRRKQVMSRVKKQKDALREKQDELFRIAAGKGRRTRSHSFAHSQTEHSQIIASEKKKFNVSDFHGVRTRYNKVKSDSDIRHGFLQQKRKLMIDNIRKKFEELGRKVELKKKERENHAKMVRENAEKIERNRWFEMSTKQRMDDMKSDIYSHQYDDRFRKENETKKKERESHAEMCREKAEKLESTRRFKMKAMQKLEDMKAGIHTRQYSKKLKKEKGMKKKEKVARARRNHEKRTQEFHQRNRRFLQKRRDQANRVKQMEKYNEYLVAQKEREIRKLIERTERAIREGKKIDDIKTIEELTVKLSNKPDAEVMNVLQSELDSFIVVTSPKGKKKKAIKSFGHWKKTSPTNKQRKVQKRRSKKKAKKKEPRSGDDGTVGNNSSLISDTDFIDHVEGAQPKMLFHQDYNTIAGGKTKM